MPPGAAAPARGRIAAPRRLEAPFGEGAGPPTSALDQKPTRPGPDANVRFRPRSRHRCGRSVLRKGVRSPLRPAFDTSPVERLRRIAREKCSKDDKSTAARSRRRSANLKGFGELARADFRTVLQSDDPVHKRRSPPEPPRIEGRAKASIGTPCGALHPVRLSVGRLNSL